MTRATSIGERRDTSRSGRATTKIWPVERDRRAIPGVRQRTVGRKAGPRSNTILGATLTAQPFRLHLHCGMSYLAGNKKLCKIDNLISMTVAGP